MSVVNNKSHGHEELKEIQNMLLENETTPSNIWETDVTGPSYVLDSLRQRRLKVIYAQEIRGARKGDAPISFPKSGFFFWLCYLQELPKNKGDLMSFICMRIKNDFHIKGWAPTLVFKQRPQGTRKRPIVIYFSYIQHNPISHRTLPPPHLFFLSDFYLINAICLILFFLAGKLCCLMQSFSVFFHLFESVIAFYCR